LLHLHESAYGPYRTSPVAPHMPAFRGKADVADPCLLRVVTFEFAVASTTRSTTSPDVTRLNIQTKRLFARSSRFPSSERYSFPSSERYRSAGRGFFQISLVCQSLWLLLFTADIVSVAPHFALFCRRSKLTSLTQYGLRLKATFTWALFPHSEY